jgi:TetR/AcrR family transcriptional repressor of nem operon
VARPKAFDPHTALAKALELFWRQGYEGTSMQDLVLHMGISRSSLYDTFGDKRGLFLAVLAYYEQEMVSPLLAPLQQPGATRERIQQVFRHEIVMALTDQLRQGCLMCNTAVELGSHDPDITAHVASNLARIEAAFAAALTHAYTSKEIQTPHPPRTLARYFTNALVGLRVQAKILPSRATLDEIVEVTLAVIT